MKNGTWNNETDYYMRVSIKILLPKLMFQSVVRKNTWKCWLWDIDNIKTIRLFYYTLIVVSGFFYNKDIIYKNVMGWTLWSLTVFFYFFNFVRFWYQNESSHWSVITNNILSHYLLDLSRTNHVLLEDISENVSNYAW